MKKIIVVMLMAMSLVTVSAVKAQFSVNLNMNIGSQPAWGPVGYDRVDYYYLPDIETYYSVPRQQYVYLNGSNWVYSNNLPARYANYNVYNGYKVVVNEPKAYTHFANHRVKYANYKGYKQHQVYIKESNDPKYYVVKGHPKYKGNNNQGNNNQGNKHDDKKGHENKGKGKGKGHH